MAKNSLAHEVAPRAEVVVAARLLSDHSAAFALGALRFVLWCGGALGVGPVFRSFGLFGRAEATGVFPTIRGGAARAGVFRAALELRLLAAGGARRAAGVRGVWLGRCAFGDGREVSCSMFDVRWLAKSRARETVVSALVETHARVASGERRETLCIRNNTTPLARCERPEGDDLDGDCSALLGAPPTTDDLCAENDMAVVGARFGQRLLW